MSEKSLTELLRNYFVFESGRVADSGLFCKVYPDDESVEQLGDYRYMGFDENCLGVTVKLSVPEGLVSWKYWPFEEGNRRAELFESVLRTELVLVELPAEFQQIEIVLLSPDYSDLRIVHGEAILEYSVLASDPGMKVMREENECDEFLFGESNPEEFEKLQNEASQTNFEAGDKIPVAIQNGSDVENGILELIRPGVSATTFSCKLFYKSSDGCSHDKPVRLLRRIRTKQLNMVNGELETRNFESLFGIFTPGKC